MSNPTSNEKVQDSCSSKTAQSGCCTPAEGNGPSCCAPGGSSCGKGKALMALLIIIAAIAVGFNSWVNGAASRTGAAPQAPACSEPCDTAPGQPGKAQPASSPTQCGVTPCPSSGVQGTATQAAAPNSSSCCPAQSPGGPAPGTQPRK